MEWNYVFYNFYFLFCLNVIYEWISFSYFLIIGIFKFNTWCVEVFSKDYFKNGIVFCVFLDFWDYKRTWLFEILGDTPSSSLMDSIMSPKVKTVEGEAVGTHSLARSTSRVEGRAGTSRWGLGRLKGKFNYLHEPAQTK
jgi:hypothetical protein